MSTKDKKVTVDEDLIVLQTILEDTKNDSIRRLEVLLVLMPTRLDFSNKISSLWMPRTYWLQNFENLQEFLNIMKNNSNNLHGVRTFQKDLDVYYKESLVLESFSTHFEGLDNELFKAFKNVEPTTIEYTERLRDQALMAKLAADAMEFFNARGDINHEIK